MLRPPGQPPMAEAAAAPSRTQSSAACGRNSAPRCAPLSIIGTSDKAALQGSFTREDYERIQCAGTDVAGEEAVRSPAEENGRDSNRVYLRRRERHREDGRPQA